MSYRCQVCTNTVPHGRSRLRHPVLRPNGSILREVDVCAACLRELRGRPLADVTRRRRPPDPAAPVVVARAAPRSLFDDEDDPPAGEAGDGDGLEGGAP